jgi:hypothetical protein
MVVSNAWRAFELGVTAPAAASKFNIAFFQPLWILEAIRGLPTLRHFLSIICINPRNGTQNAQNKSHFGCVCE